MARIRTSPAARTDFLLFMKTKTPRCRGVFRKHHELHVDVMNGASLRLLLFIRMAAALALGLHRIELRLLLSRKDRAELLILGLAELLDLGALRVHRRTEGVDPGGV